MSTLISNTTSNPVILPRAFNEIELGPHEAITVTDDLAEVTPQLVGTGLTASQVQEGDGNAVRFTAADSFNVFVDGASGSDGNDGLTAGTALQTIAKAYEIFPTNTFPFGGTDPVVTINLADNGAGGVQTYGPLHLIRIGSASALRTNYRFVGPPMVAATIAGSTSAPLDVVPATQVDQTGTPSVAADARRCRLNATTAAPGWTIDQHQGLFARITRGGSLVIPEIPITKNSANQVFIDDEGVVADVLAGDTLEIVTPGARILGPAADLGIFLLTGSGSGFVGFLNPAEIAHFTRLSLETPLVAGVQGLAFDRCAFSGIIMSGRGGSAGFANCLVTAQWAWDAPERMDSSANPSGTFIATTGRMSIVSFRRLLFRGGSANFSRRVSVWDGAGADAIRTEGVTCLTFNTVVQGSGTTGAGIHVEGKNGIVKINGGDDTLITGTGGDLQVATGAVISYGTGVGEFEEVAGFNGNFTRVLEGAAAAPTGDASVIFT